MATTLHQDCITLAISGEQKFQIHSFLDSSFDPTDLPFPEVFVFNVVSITDPKQDAFLRVANILDLTTLKRGRDKTLAANTTLYLATGFVVTYPDVLTATKAKLLIQARVDALISDWKTYTTAFMTPNAVTLPAVDSTIVAKAKADYASAKVAQTGAESALAAANTVVAAKTTVSVSANSTLVSSNQDNVACQQAATLFHAGTAAETAFRTQVDAFINTSPGGMLSFIARIIQLLTGDMVQPGGVGTTWELGDTAYQDFFTKFTTFQTYANSLVSAQQAEIANGKANLDAVDAFLFVGANAMCALKATAVITAMQAKNVADASVAAAQTALTQATAAATLAQTNAEAALANALAVCPSFDPNTV